MSQLFNPGGIVSLHIHVFFSRYFIRIRERLYLAYFRNWSIIRFIIYINRGKIGMDNNSFTLSRRYIKQKEK